MQMKERKERIKNGEENGNKLKNKGKGGSKL